MAYQKFGALSQGKHSHDFSTPLYLDHNNFLWPSLGDATQSPGKSAIFSSLKIIISYSITLLSASRDSLPLGSTVVLCAVYHNITCLTAVLIHIIIQLQAIPQSLLNPCCQQGSEYGQSGPLSHSDFCGLSFSPYALVRKVTMQKNIPIMSGLSLLSIHFCQQLHITFFIHLPNMGSVERYRDVHEQVVPLWQNFILYVMKC